MKYSKIISYARTCIANTEKYKKANVGEFTEQTLAYVFSKSILSPKKDIQVKGVDANPNPILGDVDGGIGIKNFQKLCQLYINSVDKKGKAPSYLAFNGFKIGVKAWAYATARVVVYYWEKKKMPNKVIVTYKPFYIPPKPKPEPQPTPTPSYTKYGHSDEYGCNEMGQNNGYYCGCHSLQGVFRNLTDIVVDQDTIAEVCGTTYDGTDHEGLSTCVAWFNRNYDQNLQVEWKNFSELGWDGVREIVESDNKDCIVHNLYKNTWGHYEVVNWVGDEYVGVQNSLGDSCSYGCYCGYKEDRTQSEFRSYISGISQKSIMVITNV